MKVYGDLEFKESVGGMVSRLRRRARRTNPDCLDDLRTLLIQTGQLEQGVADLSGTPASGGEAFSAAFPGITDHAAAAFYAGWAASNAELPRPPWDVRQALRALARALEDVPDSGEQTVTLRVPEGFEFYALFPEQYVLAAWQWIAEHSRAGRREEVLIVGVRSIGTTLSAVVQAAFTAARWPGRRITVRPRGHPFRREAPLPPAIRGTAGWALAVDEGPGASGSSLAAVAEGLAGCGFEPERIAFLPGHAGEPGAVAGIEIRRWWAMVPRYVVPLRCVRWNGHSLEACLAEETARLGKTIQPIESIEDFSAGEWRRFVFAKEAEWPAVSPAFEKMKFRCAARGEPAVRWKFAGLGAARIEGMTAMELGRDQISARARLGWTPPPWGECLGFMARPWIEGAPLRSADAADPAVLVRIGRYLAEVAGQPLSAGAHAAAIARLQDMAYWNTREALGEPKAARVQARAAAARGQVGVPSHGDGRLAPHEWVRDRSGRIFKPGGSGAAGEHTLIGTQSLLWDVAGVLIEWKLDVSAAAPLFGSLRAAGIAIDHQALNFYQLAYAAFRMGQTALSLQTTGCDSNERRRTEAACSVYQQALVRLLDG